MNPWLKEFAYWGLNEPIRQWLKKQYFTYQYRRGAIEEPEMRFLSRFVGPGDTVLDIGANAGLYTVRLSRLVGAAGMVHAFEPIPETFDVLCHVTRALKLKNVQPHCCALSDYVGKAKMVVPRDSHGVKNYYLAHLAMDRPSDGEGVTITTQTIDTLREKGVPRVSFLKCDVEGAELLVLTGAHAVLHSDRPILLCEVCDNQRSLGTTAAEVFEYLYDLGFRAFKTHGDSLIECDRPRHDTVNYFFLPVERAMEAIGIGGRIGEPSA